MNKRYGNTSVKVLIGGVLVLAGVVAVVAVLKFDFSGRSGSGLGKEFSTFVSPIVSSVWSKNFNRHLGWVLRADVFLTYKPGWPWKGTYLKARPSLSYGVSGDLEGDGSGLIEFAVGAPISRTYWWDVQYRIFSDTSLEEASIGREENLATKWSLFLSFTWFL